MSVELPKGSSCTLSDLFDIKTRPVTFSYLSTLAEAATTLIMALMVIGGAGKVLSSYEGEWNDEVFPLLSPVRSSFLLNACAHNKYSMQK